jgi:hypothetical protein
MKNLNRFRSNLWMATLVCLAAMLSPQAGLATTRTVTSLNDSGAGTLRSLISASAANDTIDFAVGLAGTITLTSGELVIGRNLIIIGPETASVTVNGNNASRVFNVTNATVSISDLTISNGRIVGPTGANGNAGHVNGFPGGDGLGGGILNNGNLTLTRCTLGGNSAIGGNAGAACSECAGTFPTGATGGNGAGSGIYNNGTLTLTNCTLYGNTATGGTGGPTIYIGGAGGAGFGGAIFNQGSLTIVNCTLNSNTVTGGTGGGSFFFTGGVGGNAQGGGVFNAASGAMLNTIAANGTITGGAGGTGMDGNGANGSTLAPDVYGQVNSLGHNLIRAADGGSGWVGSDLTGTVASPLNPFLGSLVNNGGATRTFALLPTSAAIEAGDDSVTNSLATDQRGRPRKTGPHVDIGAVEFQPPMIYEWTFDRHNLSAALGPGLLTYADTATPGLTSFGTTDGSTVPHIGGQPTAYMHAPGFVNLTNGYLVTLGASDPNGGGQFINQYTFIADVLLPGPLNNYLPVFNTNPQNENDADFYVAPNGAVGIQIYSSPGAVTSNTWYRIALVADLTLPRLTYFVNGVPAGTNNNVAFDGRWSLLTDVNTGADLLLFNEGDLSGTYTHEVYAAHIAIVPKSLSAVEIGVLGGPVAEGIFSRQLSVSRNGNSVILNWRGAANVGLQKRNSLTNENWQTIGATLGASNYNETATSTAFYRLVGP